VTHERRSQLLSLAIGVGTLVVLVVGWKAYVSWANVSRFVLPPPEAVASATVALVSDSATWPHVWVTLGEIVAGFAIATVLGVAIGAVLGELPVLSRAYTPFIVTFQVLPKVAIIPLLLLWLGFGSSSKVAVAAMFAFFPIVVATQAGIRSVDPGHRDLAATLQARPTQRLVLFDLPSALPSMLTGMEIGVVLATIGAIVAEYLSAGKGLGYLAVTNLNALKVDSLFAVIVLLSAMGLALHAVMAGLRRWAVAWHPSASAGSRPL
jgi:NitT/TauT family transport system permease protein